MVKKLRTQILKMLLDSKVSTAIYEDENGLEIYAIEEFQYSDHSNHQRKISIKITEEVK